VVTVAAGGRLVAVKTAAALHHSAAPVHSGWFCWFKILVFDAFAGDGEP